MSMNPKDLEEYLADPVNLHNMGLVFWINKSVADIGIPMTVHIMTTYVAKTVGKLQMPEKDKIELADMIYDQLIKILLETESEEPKINNDLQ